MAYLDENGLEYVLDKLAAEGKASTADYATTAGSASSCTGNAATATKATSADSATTATTATKLGSNAGDSNTPVYFSGGKPVACTSLDLNTSGSSASCTGNAATATTATKVGNSMTVKLNGGSTEGTNLFTYNGSAAKTINITPSAIGAAASSHGNHVPATETANNAKFLRNDNTWQTVTPSNIGAAASNHTHSNYASTVSTTGTGNAITAISQSGNTITATKGSTFSLSGHTHNYAGSSSAGGAATTALACTGNAATATTLATARTISLTGDVTGSVSFNGSKDVSITATVADDSHNHTIANVDNLQSSLDAKFDKAGGTVTGATTFNSTVTIGSAILSYDTTEQALVISFA